VGRMPEPTAANSPDTIALELRARLLRPQRHRLLQGYPSLPQMRFATFIDTAAHRAIKLLRRKNLTGRPWSGDDLFYADEAHDLRLLFITRSLAKGAFSKDSYRAFCGSSVAADFPGALGVLCNEGLIEQDADCVGLTPTGMFFSDAVVSAFIGEKQAAPHGAGVHTVEALARPTQVNDLDDGMG